MAFSPMGVAALSRPSALAAKFSVIRPSAGWPRGTSGISLLNSGPSAQASHCTTPAFSAMRRKPSHSVSVPNSSTMTSTDSRAMANSACTMAAKTWLCPPTSHWASAAIAAMMKKPSHKALSIGDLLRGCGGRTPSARYCQGWRRVAGIADHVTCHK
ncbi:hypothetical protein D3C71_1714790 [compost metagenome]